MTGGKGSNSVYLSSTEISTDQGKTWKVTGSASLPNPVYALAAATTDNRIFIFGNNFYYLDSLSLDLLPSENGPFYLLLNHWSGGLDRQLNAYYDILEYLPANQTFTKVGNMHRARSYHAVSPVVGFDNLCP